MGASLTILVPAAGAARRMGGLDKLTLPVSDEPALRRAARLAAGTGARVVVTLPPDGPHADGRRAALSGLAVASLVVADAAGGMAASLRAGAASARAAGCTALMVHLPDMPGITGEDLERMFRAGAAAPDRVLRAMAEDGRPGHPVILPARLFTILEGLGGDQGARAVLSGEMVLPVPLPGQRAICDLDTPEDWAAWNADL